LPFYFYSLASAAKEYLTYLKKDACHCQERSDAAISKITNNHVSIINQKALQTAIFGAPDDFNAKKY
jgi:hypothetical protein